MHSQGGKAVLLIISSVFAKICHGEKYAWQRDKVILNLIQDLIRQKKSSPGDSCYSSHAVSTPSRYVLCT